MRAGNAREEPPGNCRLQEREPTDPAFRGYPDAPAAPVIKHIEKLLATRTLEELWALHVARMADFGFDRLVYAFTRSLQDTHFGTRDDVLILSNHSAEYLDGFLNGGLYHDAPMVNWARVNTGPCSWRRTQEFFATGRLTPGEEKVVAYNRKHGIRAGYSISFHDVSARARGVISLCARDDLAQDDVEAIWAAHGREIAVINEVTHMRIIMLPYRTSKRTLTDRQREVLEWVASGKTIQDTATIMGLTVTTVEKHLRLAREVLNVETTAQAVLKASFQNQIFMLRS